MTAPTSPAGARSPLSDWLTSSPPPPSWLVPGIIPAGRMIVLAGAPGAGKSFLSYVLATSGATSKPFLGAPLEPFRTVYFDEENASEDAAEYLRWAWNGLDRPDPGLIDANLWHFGLQLARLSTSAARGEFMRSVVAAHQPNLIVIDTATPVMRIADENDNAEASRAIADLRRLRSIAAPKCTVIILKHMKVDTETGHHDVRGAKAWKGECDGILYLSKAPGKPYNVLGRDFSATRLYPEKVRAFGLARALKVSPRESTGGVVLDAAPYDKTPRGVIIEPDNAAPAT